MEQTTQERRRILSEYMRRLGKKGGRATKKKYGRNHFKKMRRIQLDEKPKEA